MCGGELRRGTVACWYCQRFRIETRYGSFISIPIDRDLGSCKSSHDDHEAREPPHTVSLWLCLRLCLLWALGSALAVHFPEFWCLCFPLSLWQPLSNASKWNFPMENIINLVPSAKVNCHSSNINVIEPWILPLYFYRIVMAWLFQSCPGGAV